MNADLWANRTVRFARHQSLNSECPGHRLKTSVARGLSASICVHLRSRVNQYGKAVYMQFEQEQTERTEAGMSVAWSSERLSAAHVSVTPLPGARWRPPSVAELLRRTGRPPLLRVWMFGVRYFTLGPASVSSVS